MTLTRFAQSVVLAWGWKRILIAFVAGAVATLALPPLNIWPAPFLAFPVLVWLIDGTGSGRLGGVGAAAAVGWWFGFGYFVAGLYWIGHAFLVDAQTFGWLLPFAVVLLPAGLAIYCAIGVAIARLMWMRGSGRLLALAVALTFSEWLRGHLLTGFPWNAFGYMLASPLALAQSASLVGLWGLTFVAVFIYASPVTLADDASESTRRWFAPAFALLVVAGMAGFGTLRLANTATTIVDGVRLRIMQPNLQQDAKFNYSQKQRVMAHYIALSERADGPQSTGLGDITHLIWPESAFPFFLTREADALAQIATLLPDRTTLITGAVRPPETAPPTSPVIRAYNSVYVIGHDGSVLSVYDKVHLVPFGEYLPFQDYLEQLGFIALTKMRGGFIPGDRRRILDIPRAPSALPLVCYEIIFPGAVLPAGERAGWIINLTNDGWFGLSVGPYQHFQQARVRAIEEGLPVVRAANTGISAVIDPLGNVVASLPLGAEGIFDSSLPRALPPTLYARLGDVPVVLAVGVSLIAVFRLRRSRLKKNA